MFEQSILNGATKTRRAWTVMVSFAGQIVLIGIAILIPLVAFDRMPMVQLTAPVVPPGPERPRADQPKPHVELVDVRHLQNPRPFTAPSAVPQGVVTNLKDPEPPLVMAGNERHDFVPGSPGSGEGVPYALGNPVWQIPTPPPPRDTTPVVRSVQKPKDPVPISSGVMLAKLIRQVKPVYPPLAIQTRTEGTVRLQAVISRDGIIQELQVVSGHFLLVQAAVDAVRQWVYQPTTLNGVPVEVVTTVDVHFKLSR